MVDGENTDTVGTEENPLDMAIVGGGIAGLYCLYRLLKDKDQFKGIRKIRLFECSDHLGGRIETWSLKREPSEIGYAPTWDPRHLLGELIDPDTAPMMKLRNICGPNLAPCALNPTTRLYCENFSTNLA